MFRCIGQRVIEDRKNARVHYEQCTNESETPTRADKPEWGFLCAECSGQPPRGRKTMEEVTNVGAMQSDSSEYRDQIASGFAAGARRGYEDSNEGDEE